MVVNINYDKDEGTYSLVCEELDVGILSAELSKILVLFDSYLRENNINISILESESIDYYIDSLTMRNMIVSNVSLLKLLRNSQKGFQSSKSKFGNSQLQNSNVQGISKANKFSNIINKPKGFK